VKTEPVEREMKLLQIDKEELKKAKEKKTLRLSTIRMRHLTKKMQQKRDRS
jgi:hypothetical protein